MHLESISGVEPSEAAPERPVGSRVRRRLPLSRAELLADDWSAELEAGYRLYRLFPKQSLYGLARYERAVDGETGELTEEETLVEYGFAAVEDVHVPDAEGIADGHDALRLDVGPIRNAYRQFGTNAIEEALHEGDAPLEILGEYVAYTADEAELGGMIEHDGPNPHDAERRMEIARGLAAELHPEEDPTGEDGVYYIGRLGFDNPPEWYVRAAELHLSGVLKNRPTVALVQAMSESDNPRFETQEDIADALGLTQGTVSKHRTTAEEWLDRAEWHAENG